MITVIGIFEDPELAREAASYLLVNEFKADEIDVHTGDVERIGDFFNHLFKDRQEADAHIAAAENGTIVTLHATSTRQAQEAVDVMNNYGAMDVSIPGSDDVLSRIVERPVEHIFRLKG